MRARIFSTLLLWTITVFVIIYAQTFGWAVIIGLLSAGAIYEVCKMLEKMGMSPMQKTLQVFNAFIILSAWAGGFFGILTWAAGSLAFALSMVIFCCLIVKSPYDNYFSKTILPSCATLFAVSFMLQWFVTLATAAQTSASAYTGIILSVWILAAAKFSDVGAYVLGAAFGRNKLAQTISPKKTIEGAVGGIISSAAVSAIIAWGFASILPMAFTPITAAIAGAVIGAVAIMSDLLESVLKRRANVKDSGKFIPGIGGALDLADSLLLSAPVGVTLLSIIL